MNERRRQRLVTLDSGRIVDDENAARRERYANDPEFRARRLATNARSNALDPDRARAVGARYRAKLKADPERWARDRAAVKARQVRYAARARELAAARSAAEPDRYACRRALTLSRKKYGPPEFTAEEWAVIWYGRCFDCGATPARGVDHILGWSVGGSNVLANLQPACVTCNKRKSAADRDARLGRVPDRRRRRFETLPDGSLYDPAAMADYLRQLDRRNERVTVARLAESDEACQKAAREWKRPA